MDFKVNTNEEAWNFLTLEVYQVNNGEFRIHTNKNGIRLYLRFANPKFTGRIYKYWTGVGYVTHKKLRQIIDRTYCETFVGINLVDAVNKHLENMNGDILVDDEYVLKYFNFSDLTPEQVVYEDLQKRKQISNYDTELKRLKEIYNWS